MRYFIKRRTSPQVFPQCELHGVRVIHRLPRQCPLAAANPLTALQRLRDTGWRLLDGPVPGDGLAALDVERICGACVSRLLTHPTVQRLRRRRCCA